MMTYGDHIRFLDREIERLGSRPFALSFGSLLEGLSRRGLPEAEEACRVFAATLEWPAMSDPVRFEVCARLSMTRWHCNEIASMETEAEFGYTGTEFLTDTLIDYWRDVGHHDWLQHWLDSSWKKKDEEDRIELIEHIRKTQPDYEG
jgi:hypothetical protein